jgi:hypothetical protein
MFPIIPFIIPAIHFFGAWIITILQMALIGTLI